MPAPNADVAARFAWFMACDIAAGTSGWRSLHMSKPRVDEVAPALTAAASVMLGWPTGLHAWLAARASPGPGGAGVRAAFGPVLHRMFEILAGPDFAFLHAEVRSWLADCWHGHVKPWSPLFVPRRTDTLLTGRQAASGLGVAPSRVSGLVASNLLAGRALRAGRRVAHLILAAELEELRVRAKAALTTSEAAESLGVTPGQVRRTVRAGALAAMRNPPGRPRGVYVEARALDALRVRLDQACMLGNPCGPGYATLAALSGRRRTSLVAALNEVLHGRLPVQRSTAGETAPLLARYGVCAARAVERRRSGSAPSPPACMSVREAARALRLSVRMLPRLVQADCLEAAYPQSGAGALAKRAVTAASVSAFSSRYVTASSLAADRRTSTRVVTRRLAEAGIVPVVARDPVRGISAVWFLSDCRDVL